MSSSQYDLLPQYKALSSHWEKQNILFSHSLHSPASSCMVDNQQNLHPCLDGSLVFFAELHSIKSSKLPVKQDLSASQDRCTCSMQGEKEHTTPSSFNIFPTEGKTMNNKPLICLPSRGSPLFMEIKCVNMSSGSNSASKRGGQGSAACTGFENQTARNDLQVHNYKTDISNVKNLSSVTQNKSP
nr:hypothetical protein Iba_chr11dCG1500 [Ipomoea batatas]